MNNSLIIEKIQKVYADYVALNKDTLDYFQREMPNIEVGMILSDSIEVSISQMYESPVFNSEIIFALCEAFGTKTIDSDGVSYGGCETCDWGSSYGHNLIIRNYA